MIGVSSPFYVILLCDLKTTIILVKPAELSEFF